MAKITIGQNGGKVQLDLDRLIAGRLLVQGASGAGKSWLLRVLAEEVGKHIPIIVIDPEGEFATLREKLDIVLVGCDGDLPADPKNAAMLARKIVGLKLSTVIDLYDLMPSARCEFVQKFVDGLMGLPKSMWAPCAVFIDEAHTFCPQETNRVSSASVERLMSQGRKRGLCGVLATTRLSKLDKDAAAECRTVIVGGTSPIDQRRAADMLGVTHKDLKACGRLPVGEWMAVGPALGSVEVVSFKSATPNTSHPKTGMGISSSPAPSTRIRGVLAELKELARKDTADPITLDEAKEDINRLRRELKAARRAAKRAESPTVVDQNSIDRAVAKAIKAAGKWKNQVEAKAGPLKSTIEQLSQRLESLLSVVDEPVLTRTSQSTETSSIGQSVNGCAKPSRKIHEPTTPQKPRSTHRNNGKKPSGWLRMIYFLVDRAPAGFTESRVATGSRLKRGTGSWGNNKSKLVVSGWLDIDSYGIWRATQSAIDEFGDPSRAPATQEEIIDAWKDAVGGTPARMLDHLIEAYPDGITRQDLADLLGIKWDTGSFGNNLSTLRTNGLIRDEGKTVFASEELLGV